jgi:hypothetical protein
VTDSKFGAMNFSPFGSHFPASIPSIHQFAAKLSHDAPSSFPPQPSAVVVSSAEGTRYHSCPQAHFANQHPIAVPVNMGKYASRPDGTNQGNHPSTTQTLTMLNSSSKYLATGVTGHHFVTHATGGSVYNQNNVHQQNQSVSGHSRPPTSTPGPSPQQQLQQQQQQQQQSVSHNKRTYHTNEMQQAQDLCNAMMSEVHKVNNDKNMETKRENAKEERPSSGEIEYGNTLSHGPATAMPPSWQSLATPGSTVADYLSHLPASTLPLSLHHFLKYSAENIKKEAEVAVTGTPAKKKKKKKPPKEKKPRPKPGEIRLTTALDGSTLYCCPECHMAYPEKELLEQHLVGHKLERRFICDICGAGLKRKDHLTRHKQSHNPDRPFVCTICMKAFKRKEQLTLHFVIHSGEKRHVCSECGKGFYRKDHLRKHTRSHIARRVKAEMTQHTTTPTVATAAATTSTGLTPQDGPPPPLLS